MVIKLCQLRNVSNVSYHKSNNVKRHLKSSNGCIKIIHFLRYTHELNPIKIQWREIKKNLGNQFFAGTIQMKNCIRRPIRTGDVPVVKLFNYLTF